VIFLKYSGGGPVGRFCVGVSEPGCHHCGAKKFAKEMFFGSVTSPLAQRCHDSCFLLPTVPYESSCHPDNFGGSLSRHRFSKSTANALPEYTQRWWPIKKNKIFFGSSDGQNRAGHWGTRLLAWRWVVVVRFRSDADPD
jgi:hypothetical protein